MRKGLKRRCAPSDEKRAGPLRVLFICSRNRKRSPTAEQIFSGLDGVETASAGLAPDADEVVSAEILEWAEVIVVMEAVHRRRLTRRYAPHIRHAKIVCLDIPDRYEFKEAELIQRLEACVPMLLHGLRARRS